MYPPTNTCFDDALDFVGLRLAAAGPTRATAEPLLEALKVVHGICRAPDGTLYAHAWVIENESQVWQATIIGGQRVFYSVGVNQFTVEWRPVEETRYTVIEADRLNESSGHFGPWEAKYVELCRSRPDDRSRDLGKG